MKRPTLAHLKNKADEMELAEAISWLNQLHSEYGDSVKRLADKYNRRLELNIREEKRLEAMTFMEKEAYAKGFHLVGGVDEAGRGPLAGPVVAACCILPKDFLIEKLNDSKKLSPELRDKLFDIIRQKAVSYGIGIVENTVIDEINILNATKKAMEIAIKAMKITPDYLIIDALRLNVLN